MRAARGLAVAVGLVAALLAVGSAIWLSTRRDPPIDSSSPSPLPPVTDQQVADDPPVFEDVTPTSGVAFSYRNGEEANRYTILESLGGGVALFDYDGDGLLDIFLTGGGRFEGDGPPKIVGLPSKLYRNLGNWKFEDVTAAAGLDKPLFYTHGVAVADYDRDGFPDLLVTGWGRDGPLSQ